MSPRLASATPATRVVGVHPRQDYIYRATHVVAVVSSLEATQGSRCVASKASHKHGSTYAFARARSFTGYCDHLKTLHVSPLA